MIDVSSLVEVKKEIELNIGEKVMLKANRGRRKCFIKEAIIEDTYNNVFTVMVRVDSKTEQRFSYTYSDVLTSNVELVICKNNLKIHAG